MRIVELIGTFFIGVIFGVIYICTINAHTTPIEIPEPEIQYVYVEPEKVVEYVYIPFEEVEFRNFTAEEEWYLKDLAMREAEGEGEIGQVWVMYTGLCRCEAFGQSIEEMWGSSAFETSMNRSGLSPNEDCEKAFELIREGWEPKPLYFGRNYYHSFATDLCQVGNHCFSSK